MVKILYPKLGYKETYIFVMWTTKIHVLSLTE